MTLPRPVPPADGPPPRGEGRGSAVGPRDRMVRSAARLMQERGITGTGLRDVAAHARAPRGSLQHYFPGGKQQVVAEAIAWAGQVATRRVHRAAERAAADTPDDPAAAAPAVLRGLLDLWRRVLTESDYGVGCPLVAAVADAAADSDALRDELASAFAAWCAALAEVLRRAGVPDARAARLASVCICAIEGALVLARAGRSLEPLDAVEEELGPLLVAATTGGTPG